MDSLKKILNSFERIYITSIASLSAFIFIFFMPTLAHAQCCGGLPMGYYLEGNIGFTTIGNNAFGSGTTSTSKNYGISGAWGYKFMPYFGGELGIVYFGKSTIKSGGNTIANGTTYAGYAALKGILPISDTGFETFAKLGVAQVRSKISITNSTAAAAAGLSSKNQQSNGLYEAVGVGYTTPNNFEVIFQWSQVQTGSSNKNNYSLLSLGFIYLFPC